MSYIKVHVQTGAKVDAIKKISGDLYEIDVKAPAKNNAANRRIIEILKKKPMPNASFLLVITTVHIK